MTTVAWCLISFVLGIATTLFVSFMGHLAEAKSLSTDIDRQFNEIIKQDDANG